MDSITTIKDCRVKVKASKELIDLLEKQTAYLNVIPENIRKFLQIQSLQLPSNLQTIGDNMPIKMLNINFKLLKDLLNEEVSKNSSKNQDDKKLASKSKNTKASKVLHLYLSDLRWLSNFLANLRKEQGLDVYLNDVLETCQLQLPENEIIKRNPVLEARCQKLREQQQNLEYRKMTKNVDAILKHYPEDTVAYQSIF